MPRCTNVLFAALNLLLGLAAAASLLTAFLLFPSSGHALRHATVCHRALHAPLLVLGLSLAVLAALGLLAVSCRSKTLLYLYSLLAFLLFLGLLASTVFFFVVTNPGAGKAVSGLGFSEYKLGNYSRWLQRHFVNDRNWGSIVSCLVDSRVCNRLDDPKASDFFRKQLPSIQSGCCKPPVDCGFRYRNATFWEVPESGPAIGDEDCMKWSNNPARLCYNCDSCRGGVIANIKKQWRSLAVFNIILTLLAVFSYSTSCCVLWNIDKDRTKHYGRIAFP